MTYTLEITVESDATFSRGDGVAGSVDAEIEYEAATGLPFLRGRALRGLLVEECANLLYALRAANAPQYDAVRTAAERLFGRPGSRREDVGALAVDAAVFPATIRQAIRYAIYKKEITAEEVRGALTMIRRQTAIDDTTGVSEKNSLRSQRAVVRGVTLSAPLMIETAALEPEQAEMEAALLAACAGSLRRGGTGRNRGRGRLKCYLRDAISGDAISDEALWKEADA